MVRQAIFLLAVVVTFGVALPWVKGYDFLNPIFILGYACLGVLFVTPAATEAFRQPADKAGLLGRMLGIWAYGWGISVLMIVSGIVTVNSRHWSGGMVMPPGRMLAAALLLGATSCFATVAGGAALGRKWGPNRAKTLLRFSFLALLLLLSIGFRFMPEDWRAAVEENLTTSGLTLFAWRLGAFLALLGAALAVWSLKATARPAETGS
jgi:hypothetical protein